MNDRKETVQLLAREIASSMREYREAVKRDPDYAPIREYNLLDDLDQAIKDADFHGGIYSAHNLSMTAATYWEDILRAKIRIIGIFGGVALMREVSSYLEELDEQGSSYNYASLFNVVADGISGWMA